MYFAIYFIDEDAKHNHNEKSVHSQSGIAHSIRPVDVELSPVDANYEELVCLG